MNCLLKKFKIRLPVGCSQLNGRRNIFGCCGVPVLSNARAQENKAQAKKKDIFHGFKFELSYTKKKPVHSKYDSRFYLMVKQFK